MNFDLILVLFNGERAGEDLPEADDSFGAKKPHRLQAVVDQVEQMLVITRVDFHQHIV